MGDRLEEDTFNWNRAMRDFHEKWSEHLIVYANMIHKDNNNHVAQLEGRIKHLEQDRDALIEIIKKLEEEE